MKKLLGVVLSMCAFAQVSFAQPSEGDRVGLEAHPNGGTDIYKSLSVTGTPAAVKNTQGQVYGVYGVNKSACRRYLKIFNKKASEVVLGVDVPILTIPIFPRSDTYIPNTLGAPFSNGISVACTNYEADNNASGASANECSGTLFYK